MNSSMYEGLIIAAYITVFITATTLTIFLFTSVQDYADKAYEYSNRIASGSVMQINTQDSEQDAVILRGNELISYYYNYISYDAYTSNYRSTLREEMRSKSKYNVIVNGISINDSGKIELSYTQFLNQINLNKTYSLRFISYTNEIKNIEIKEIGVM